MSLKFLDGSLQVEVFFEQQDRQFKDNVCIRFTEDCPDGERLLRADETNIYLTPRQARQLSEALLKAARSSEGAAQSD